MKRLFLTLLSGCALLSATAQPLTSPNGKVTMTVENGKATLMFNQQKVMDMTGDFSPVTQAPSTVTADYTMLAGKRRHCTNEANEYQSGSLTVRLYNDGVAIRESQASTLTYLIPEGMKRWMEQWTDSYEGFFPLSTTYKVQPVPSFSGISKSAEGYNNRWGYPALLETSSQKGAKVFALITEANILKGNSASCLFNDGERYRVVPDEAQPSTISPQP